VAAVTMKNGIPLNLFDDGDDYEIAEEHEAEAREPGPGVAFAEEEPSVPDRQTVGPSDRQTAVPEQPAPQQPTTPEQWSAIAQENAMLRERWARLEERQQLINQGLAQARANEQQQYAAVQQQAWQQAIQAHLIPDNPKAERSTPRRTSRAGS